MKAKIKGKISIYDFFDWDDDYDDYYDYWRDDWWRDIDYNYLPGTTIIDIMSIYSKERLRDRKLDYLFGNSNEVQTLGDFWQIKK
jgi:hypothetical protein